MNDVEDELIVLSGTPEQPAIRFLYNRTPTLGDRCKGESR